VLRLGYKRGRPSIRMGVQFLESGEILGVRKTKKEKQK